MSTIEVNRNTSGSITSPRAWRYAAAAFWMLSGANHLRSPLFYQAIVPPPLDRWKNEVNAAAGVVKMLADEWGRPGSDKRDIAGQDCDRQSAAA